ncbi:MlaD family protein [Candidatus Odyssella thessalonicensis]|uniref:MlaD family protein n=1 Tax=Candidatus Odyssella thessalonicensis TaxID=84647 RepID=UPI0004971427|nr:MlaD family protein [Candidatus Odyssella thessalonicensis]
METQVNYVRVGMFVVGGFLAMILFILWLHQFGFGESTRPYHIYYKGSVSGLKVGGAVQYRGVPIGKVSTIKIDPKNVEQIIVTVDIDKTAIIKEDMIATLESHGLTGISYIQINGGTTTSRRLIDISHTRIPVIPSKSSLYEQVSATLPDMLQKMDYLITDIRGVFNDENREAFSKTMKNIEEITTYFKPDDGHDKDAFLLELTKAIATLNATLTEIQFMSKEFTELMKENRGGLREFTTSGLNSFSRFMIEGRESLAAIRRITESLERSPSRFFYNDPKQGVPAR